MDKRKVILDCDTRSDGAVTIMLAALADKLDLLGVCTVAGNKSLDFTTPNTLAVIEALGKEIPRSRLSEAHGVPAAAQPPRDLQRHDRRELQ